MEFLGKVSEALWGVPTAAALVLISLWLGFRTGFVQIRKFPDAMRMCAGDMFKKPGEGGVSPFEAVCTALAGTVGTGNIAGVVLAITLGGPGAVFWMWVSALLGMGTKYVEIYLAVKYRERRGDEYVGGPMYCVKNGLGEKYRPLAVLFCVFCAAASFGIGNMMQMGSILTLSGTRSPVSPAIWGAVMGLLVYLTCRNGASGRGRAAATVVPLMAAVYSLGALGVIFANLPRLPWALGQIFAGAFSKRAALGGAAGCGAGTALSYGLRRGMFSNEAGLGSSPIAHASSGQGRPERQALLGIFEVFVDTLLICTLTALMVLCSGVELRFGVPGGAEYCAQALSTVFGARLSGVFMTVSMTFFAFSSMVGWSLYGERCVGFLLPGAGERWYRLAFAAVTFISSLTTLTLAIRISDILNALMIGVNLVCLVLLVKKGAVPVSSGDRASPGRAGRRRTHGLRR